MWCLWLVLVAASRDSLSASCVKSWSVLCAGLCPCGSVIFCEATAIYGVIVAIILQTKIEFVPALADGALLHARPVALCAPPEAAPLAPARGSLSGGLPPAADARSAAPDAAGTYPGAAVFSGYATFGSGITVGFANLVCGCATLRGALSQRCRPRLAPPDLVLLLQLF